MRTWLGRGLYLGATATGAYFAGVVIRAASRDAMLSPTVAAIALPIWALLESRRDAYAPLAALPIGACLGLWAYLDLFMVGDGGLETLAAFSAGIPVGVVVSFVALLASFFLSLGDPAKPSRVDRALRGAGWLALGLSVALLLLALRSLWGRPTPTQYAASIPVTARLPSLVEGQPQDYLAGRLSLRRRVIDGHCPIDFAVDRVAPPVTLPMIDTDDGTPPSVDTSAFMPCGEIVLRAEEAHGFVVVEAAEERPFVLVFGGEKREGALPPVLVADVTGPPRSTFLPPILGVAAALLALLRKPPRPGEKRSSLVQGEFDDDVSKLYIDGEDTPIPWRDEQVPGGRVVVVLAPPEPARGESFRSSAREAREHRVLGLLPGKLADLGHEERTRWACVALAMVVSTAAPLAGTLAWWAGRGP